LPKTRAEHRKSESFDLKNPHLAIGTRFSLATDTTPVLEQKANTQMLPLPQDPCTSRTATRFEHQNRTRAVENGAMTPGQGRI
jgi:hypothetical protein